ncbi:hypothetical protein PRBRB14_23010 [Hallella multisaccharivorax DSM 17128]|uniref:hypothetical protein n=1 Tax=Hallella multisaccharivorax TaxID=310514 RepID=UPI0012EAC086|nr:hypothetical protein [Hallella multisaccharivorax]GJG31422.1 hypothetical protein PRBRB14_23010 [Hallella multisaccharivorax DSM 17128]
MTLYLRELAGKAVTMLYENKDRQTMSKITRVGKDGSMRVAIPAMGGLIVKE